MHVLTSSACAVHSTLTPSTRIPAMVALELLQAATPTRIIAVTTRLSVRMRPPGDTGGQPTRPGRNLSSPSAARVREPTGVRDNGLKCHRTLDAHALAC